MVAVTFRIDSLDEQRTGFVNLEGKVACGRHSVAVGDRSLRESKGPITCSNGILLRAGDEETVTDYLFLDVSGEIFGVGEIPSLVA